MAGRICSEDKATAIGDRDGNCIEGVKIVPNVAGDFFDGHDLTPDDRMME
jgi:hypothetical protein